MRIYLNREPVTGPWGGGNKTVDMLKKKFVEKGWDVVHDLSSDEIDVIFCIDPRPNSRGEWYQNFLNYKQNHNKTKIIQRVGDVGTHSKPELTELVKQSTVLSDFVIFPSDWARKYIGFKNKNYLIVNNRPKSIFFKNRRNYFSDILEENKVKIITHHWSMNEKKGFDVYNALSNFLSNNKTQFELTYVGRYNGEPPKGIKHIGPQDDNSLKNILPFYDIYLTASLEEAGANHVLEGLAAGLPIVYREGGGSIEEYCRNFGLEYENSLESLLSCLYQMVDNYRIFKQKALSYNQKIEESINQYVGIIEDVAAKK